MDLRCTERKRREARVQKEQEALEEQGLERTKAKRIIKGSALTDSPPAPAG